MPGRDGTGNPAGGFGRGLGRGLRLGRGRGLAGRPLGSDFCYCSKCKTKVPHDQRGVPCIQISCPKCGTKMTGEYCG